VNACLLLDAAEVGAVMGKPFQLLGGGPTGPGGIAPLPLIPSQPDIAGVWGSSCAFAAEVPPSNGRSSLVEVTT